MKIKGIGISVFVALATCVGLAAAAKRRQGRDRHSGNAS